MEIVNIEARTFEAMLSAFRTFADRLDTLCQYLHLELNHHQAGSDSRACGQILLHLMDTGASLSPFMRTYDFIRIGTVRPSRNR